jgi:hypothetical protein
VCEGVSDDVEDRAKARKLFVKLKFEKKLDSLR